MSSDNVACYIRLMQNAETIWAAWREKIRLSALARVLSSPERPISRQAVISWTQVPEDWHVAVAAWLGVKPSDLRPDLHNNEESEQ